MEPTFFRLPEEFRAWLQAASCHRAELLLGFYKKRSGVTGFTQAQAVDEALCFGWIDGHVRAIDANRYTARFTPRTPQSIWSAVNIRRAEQLIAQGRMEPSGLERPTPSAIHARLANTPSRIVRSRSTRRTRRHFAPTCPRGRSSRRSRPHTGAPPSGG